MTKSYNYQMTHFVTSASDIRYLPIDSGSEIAFVGRSNAGKSSALNTLTNQKNLARISKTPGRTQLINLFEVEPGIRLVDLPGYGYAKVPEELKRKFQRALGEYLHKRNSLKGLVVLMDIRHPMKDLDQQMVQWAVDVNIPILVLLTKADKLAFGARKAQLNQVREAALAFMGDVEIETFSSLKKQGVDKLQQKLDTWFAATPLAISAGSAFKRRIKPTNVPAASRSNQGGRDSAAVDLQQQEQLTSGLFAPNKSSLSHKRTESTKT